MAHRKTRKRGGEFVGQGTYGCGFYPGFPCKGDNASNTRSFFTKIMYTRFANEEWQVSEKMKKIDPSFKFSLYPYKICPPNFDDVERYIREGISQCSMKAPHEFYRITDDKYMLRTLIRNKSLMMLQSEQGGISLNSIDVSPVELYSFFKGFINLFNGIEFYQNKGFYHLDIKPPNIVSRKEPDGSYNTRFIDFGMGKLMSEIIVESPSYIYTHFPDYPYYPYELRYLERWSDFKENNFDVDQENVDRYINGPLQYVTYYVPQENYYTYDRNTGEYNPIINYMSYKLVARAINNRNNYENILSKHLYKQLLDTADVYALGVTLAEVYRRLIKHYMHFGTIYKVAPGRENIQLTPQTAEFPIEYLFGMEISKPMYELIKKMTDRNPFMRPTIKGAKYEFKEIVEKMKPFFGMANMNEHPEIGSIFGTNENSFVEKLPPPPPSPQMVLSPPSPSPTPFFISPPSTPESPIGQYIRSPTKRGGVKTRRRTRK
jgi:serine/threonine protein kinase